MKKGTLIMMSIKSHIIVTRKKVIMQILARSIKTKINLTTSILMTNVGEKMIKMSCIYYPI